MHNLKFYTYYGSVCIITTFYNTFSPLVDTRCNHGEVRLFGGFSDRDGAAEVCINGYWGDICDTHWDNVDATVFCKQHFGDNSCKLLAHAYTFRIINLGPVLLAHAH